MVQRALSNKFGVQISDGVKGERRSLASFKPTSSFSSSSQNPDGKNRASDLKKKMKKSRAIQLSDFESLNSSPIRKNVSLPGKPPPNYTSNDLEIKQKQNQPSPVRTSHGSPNYMKSTSCFDARKEVCSDGKKPRRRSLENSTHVSVSGLKPTKYLTKSSSMKLVRTLTKTASFKKSSNSLRATCSSTLKDSKFPAYLMLSPEATESEGTSAMKVCPYTYCSLNGHRHAPLPPLKCFLSARRRLLKTQKNLKVQPSGCGVKVKGVDDVDDEGGLTLDFFMEIYAENKVDGVGSVDQERVMNGGCAGVSSSTVAVEADSSNEENRKPIAENVYDGSMEDSEVGLSEEVAERIFFHGDEYEDDAGSTDTEMEEWEEQRFLSMESDGLDEVEDQSNGETGCLSEEGICLQDRELVGSGDVVEDCKGMFFKTEKEFNEKSGEFEKEFYIGDSELNHHPDWEVEEASQVSASLSFDQLSYLEDAFDEMDATAQAVVERAEIEYYLELILKSELEAEVAETHCVIEEASNNEQEKQDLQVDGTDGDCIETNEEHCGIHEEVLQFDCQLPNHDLVLQEELLDVDIDNQIEKEKQVDDANHGEEVVEVENSGQESSDKCLEAHLSDGQCQDISATGNWNSVAEQDEIESSTVLEMTGNEEPSDSKTEEACLNDNSTVPIDIMEGKDRADSLVKTAKLSCTAIDSTEELDISSKNWEVNTKCKRLGDESEDPRNFNPREPNYLPLVPDPDSEKVDLKHQLMDDRKNAEEWMLDHALQQTVTKLAPAKKKKVALLVEAFESVMPTSRYEMHLRNNASRAFTPAKHIQACF